MKRIWLARILLILIAIPYGLIGIGIIQAAEKQGTFLPAFIVLAGAGVLWYCSLLLSASEREQK